MGIVLCASFSTHRHNSGEPLHLPFSSSSSVSADGLCHSGLYTDGEWVRSDSEWYPYFTGDHKTLSCDRSALDSIWQFNATQRAMSTVPPEPSRLNSSQMYVRPALKYVWSPSHCELARFPLTAPVDFCLALSSRPVLFVGDSLSYQQYQSLIFLLGDSFRSEQLGGANSGICNRLLDEHYTRAIHGLCALDSRAWPYTDTPRLCVDGRWVGNELPPALNSSHVRIRFVRNDHLSNADAVAMYAVGPRTDVESPWRHLVRNDTILIINRGVHVVEAARFRDEMVEVLRWLRSAHPCATILWRSSVPGHADCNSVWQQTPLSRERYDHFDRQDQLLHRGNTEYRWEEVRQLNAVARQLIRSANFSLSAHAAAVCSSSYSTTAPSAGAIVELDVDSFDKLRSDSHRPGDCLHQCLPGPVDTWNRLLYNVLIGRAS